LVKRALLRIFQQAGQQTAGTLAFHFENQAPRQLAGAGQAFPGQHFAAKNPQLHLRDQLFSK